MKTLVLPFEARSTPRVSPRSFSRSVLVPLVSLLAFSSRGYFEKRDGIIKQQLDPWILFRRASNHHTNMPDSIFTLLRPRTRPPLPFSRASFETRFHGPCDSRAGLARRSSLVCLERTFGRNPKCRSLAFSRGRNHTLCKEINGGFRTGEEGLRVGWQTMSLAETLSLVFHLNGRQKTNIDCPRTRVCG